MQYSEFKQQFHINLNPQQEAAVQSVDGAVLLLAVPGSGKTTVLVCRLGYMIFCKEIKPEQILTLTYTVAATADMRRRFEQYFGSEYSKRMEFRTINGIAQKILQYFGRITGKRPFEIAEREGIDIIKRVYLEQTRQYATENDLKNIQTAITYVKNMRLKKTQIEKLEVEVTDFPKVYEAYNKELRKFSLMDYDDQMVYALQILEQFPKVLTFFKQQYPYICVDEAQDTSKLQHDMINLLTGENGNLFMVGDEDQSIYGFRAAYPDALVQFEQKHPGARVLLMESNYRSREEIVTFADRLIQKNKSRHEKHMLTTRTSGGELQQIKLKSRKNQYSYLLKMAEDCETETAILYRNHESALPLIDLFERNGISYRVKNSDMTFFSHPIVNDIRDYIALAKNPYEEDAFLRIYYKMGAGISKTAAIHVAENNRRKKSLLEAVADLKEVSPYTRKQCRALNTHFKNMCYESAGKAIYRILHFMGYQEYMDSHGMDSKKAEILQILGDQEDNLFSFPDRLDTLHDVISAGNGHENCKIILSTIHSSKGLEYNRVYLIDMLDGILPTGNEPTGRHADPKELAAYEEERRLYYVAMTRAKEELHIFTFGDKNTSAFSKLLFTKAVKPAYAVCGDSKRACKVADNINLSDYEEGVVVLHTKYGQGVVCSRKKNIAEILFDQDTESRRISLPIAIEKGILFIL